jgi:hypothetical protein
MRVAASALVAFLTACSVYIPQPVDVPPPQGTEVRVRLTTAGAVRVSQLLGRPTEEIQGQILEANGDSLGLSLISASEYRRPWDVAESLTVAREEYFQLDERRLDRKRTALFVGGVGVMSGIVIAGLFKAATRSKDGERPGEIDVTLIPLFSVRH